MAKEWILNQSMNRWGLNKKRSVGPVSELIRNCSPKSVDDWETYYYTNVHPEKYLDDLGRKLFIKITEVVQYEVSEVTENDCIKYIKDVIFRRTFDGYQTEIQTIYGQLQNEIDLKIEPAPDKWDRLFNVDFFIKVNKSYIGLQIKPITFEHTFEDYKWKEMQSSTHEKFMNKYGGQVFTIFSTTDNKKKRIVNLDIIATIIEEIEKLKSK